MSFNFILYFLSYFLLVFSVIGYGLFLVNCSKVNFKSINLGYVGLAGIFLLVFYSYISHYFLSHNYIHNVVVFFIGIFFLFYFRKYFKKKNLLILLSIFLFLFISILIFKTHDDFPYYHFPYTYYLTQNNILPGIGNLNHGFRTPSSIFYINSLFYLPYIKFFHFHLAAVMIMGFSIFIMLNFLFQNIRKNNYDFYFFLSLFSLVFILIFFYRISEHGTDRSAQILIFLLILEIIYVKNNLRYLSQESVVKLFILIGLIISLKAFYILYLIFFLLLIIQFFKQRKIYEIFNYLNNLYFYIFVLITINVLSTNFFNTGCFLYPIYFTCIDTFSWSIPIKEVISMNNWYEQWSKAGANPNFRVENPEVYIQGFNWISNWINDYFFTKVSDFLLGIIFLVLIFFVLFYSKKNKVTQTKIHYISIYYILLILFFEWLYNHPTLRYGGYPIISLIVFIPCSYFLSRNLNLKKINYKINFILLLSIFIFLGRNIDRISNEITKYNYKPLNDVFYKIESKDFVIDNKINQMLQDYKNCKPNFIKCNFKSSNLKLKVFNSFYIINRN